MFFPMPPPCDPSPELCALCPGETHFPGRFQEPGGLLGEVYIQLSPICRRASRVNQDALFLQLVFKGTVSWHGRWEGGPQDQCVSGLSSDRSVTGSHLTRSTQGHFQASLPLVRQQSGTTHGSHTPAARSFPGANARSWAGLGEARPATREAQTELNSPLDSLPK